MKPTESIRRLLTIVLLISASACAETIPTIDQSQEPDAWLNRHIGPTYSMGQSFEPAMSYLTGVDLYMYPDYALTGQFTAQIWLCDPAVGLTSDPRIGNSPLATVTLTGINTYGGPAYRWVHYEIDPPLDVRDYLVGSTILALWTADIEGPDIAYKAGGEYPRGAYYRMTNTGPDTYAWYRTTEDIGFRTWGLNSYEVEPQWCGDLGTVYKPGDLDSNCYINLLDLAELAVSWLDDYTTSDLTSLGRDWLACTDPCNPDCDVFWKPGVLGLSRPLPYEVVQRTGYVPEYAHENNPGGPVIGSGAVTVQCELSSVVNPTFEYRVIALAGIYSESTEWTPFNMTSCPPAYCGTADVRAGGWYRLEVRVFSEGGIVGIGAVEPVGVGEVFLIAGGQNAAGTAEELIAVADPCQRVVAYDVTAAAWDVADDPQPHLGDDGTIWVPMANRIVPLLEVPMGLIMVTGAGPSQNWLPGQPHYNDLLAAGQAAGLFRAVLWQQGESDAALGVATSAYFNNLTATRTALNAAWGLDVPWVLAKSTLDPVAGDPDGEQNIRDAIVQLCETSGFLPGPDTDILDGDNRAVGGFTSRGQHNAGDLWFASIWQTFYCE